MSVYSRDTLGCPWLASIRDRSTKYGFPTKKNACFAPDGPSDLSFEHQNEYCLGAQFDACPYFSKLPELSDTGQQNLGENKSKVRAFLPLGSTVLGIVFLVLAITFLARANFTPEAFSILLPKTPTPLTFPPTRTPVPTINRNRPSPTATNIPSTATAVPTSGPTIATPIPSPTATAIPSTATPVPTSEPTIAIPDTVTPVPPTATKTATPTKQPTAALRYQVVALLEPRNEQTVNSETATFEWQVIRLQAGDRYELWLKRVGSPTWEKRFPVAGGKFVLSVRDAVDYGDYIWNIVVLDALGQVVSPNGEERKLLWRPREAPSSQNSTSSSPFIKP